MSKLYDITPFSLLDYPGEMSCIAWFAGCNMRCVYCHNPKIVTSKGDKDEAELLNFLERRKGKLTAVVFSGGEATLYAGLPDLINKAKAMGFKIKLDTNGSRPEVLQHLLAEGVLDYVAMDYKCGPDMAEQMIGTAKLWLPFRQSLMMMIAAAANGQLTFEVRTTVHPDLLNVDALNSIINDLDAVGYRGTYYLQNIASTGDMTIGNIAEPESALDRTNLIAPKNFELGFRNF